MKQNMIYNHIPLDQEWKLLILHELLKVKEDNFVLNNFDDQLFMFQLETKFIYYTLFLFLSYNIVPHYLCVRNKSIIKNNYQSIIIVKILSNK